MAIESNEALPLTVTQVDLTNMVPAERSQAQENMEHTTVVNSVQSMLDYRNVKLSCICLGLGNRVGYRK